MAFTLQVLQTGILPYLEVYEIQKKIHALRILNEIPDTLILTEHPPIITLGSSTKDSFLKVSPNSLQDWNVELIKTDRGGEATYHGPGQLVAYPILNLAEHKMDLHWYLHNLEECMIQTCLSFGIEATRQKGLTGCWINHQKIGAIGIKCKKWVTLHGLALNIENDLSYFNLIDPCGITSYGVTRLKDHLPRTKVSISETRSILTDHFIRLFGFDHSKRVSLSSFEMVFNRGS